MKHENHPKFTQGRGGEMIKRMEGVSAGKGDIGDTYIFSDFILMNISGVPKVITGLKG